MKKLRVTIEGKNFDVLVELLEEHHGATAPATALPRETATLSFTPPAPVATMTAAPAATAVAAPVAVASGPKGPGDVLSPLAGKVVSIDVHLGQAVVEGAQVATIEAMKMNTYIYAPKAGRVETIFVNPGDGVEEGMVLLRIV
jgi:biotin carboxyl carrier protein